MPQFPPWFSLASSLSLHTNSDLFCFSDIMADFSEVPLELQLREAHRCIQSHLGKGHKYAQFLSLMFLRWFPAIMDNQINVDWDCVMGIFNRAPIFPITLIDTEILDYWCAHPTMRKVVCNMQHSRHVLVMVHYTLASGPKGKPALIYGASFIYILVHQAQTSLTDTLSYLRHYKEDCVILVSTPIKPTYSPQPWREGISPCCPSTATGMQIAVH